MSAPIATFERIYAHLGMDLTPALKIRLEAYAARNKPGSRGAHAYSAEEYGLSDANIRAAFGAYVARFRLQVAGPGM